MISLMQEDTRKAKEHGAENLTIGYFVMKVTLLKTAIIIIIIIIIITLFKCHCI